MKIEELIQKLVDIQTLCEKQEDYLEDNQLGAYYRGKVDGLEVAIFNIEKLDEK